MAQEVRGTFGFYIGAFSFSGQVFTSENGSLSLLSDLGIMGIFVRPTGLLGCWEWLSLGLLIFPVCQSVVPLTYCISMVLWVAWGLLSFPRGYHFRTLLRIQAEAVKKKQADKDYSAFSKVEVWR